MRSVALSSYTDQGRETKRPPYGVVILEGWRRDAVTCVGKYGTPDGYCDLRADAPVSRSI
jgi:hypothetical protein